MIRQDHDESEADFAIRKDKTEKRRSNVMTLLKLAGVDRVDMDYDGSGDSGNVNDPVFFSKEETIEPQIEDVNEVLMDLAYAELPGGWEINEGSYGTLKFDLNERKYEYEHNQRVESVETTTDEGEF